MKKYTLSFLFVFIVSFAMGQTSLSNQAKSILAQRGELCFYFNIPQNISMERISRIISIDNVNQNTVYAYANKEAFQAFRELGISYHIKEDYYTKGNVTMASTMNDFILSWDTYPTYYQYDSLMQKLANDYPDLCNYHVLGTLPSGRKILALQIGDQVNTIEQEPRFLYTSTMHGDELTAYVLMLRLANYLLSNYGQNALVDSLMNNVEIWINPLANPDGAYFAGNTSLSSAKRYNGNYVDLNRNYPDPDDGQHPDGKVWQPETIIFKAFADSFGFNMAANFHGGAEVANYPWDTWSKLTADDSWWKYVCKEYADSAQANSANGYFTGPSAAAGTGVINGYQWYPIVGGRQDYMNYYQHCREFTVELSNQKTPNASYLPYYWNANKSAMLYYIKQAQYGLQGVVTDSISKQPIKAKVFINGHDQDESHVFSHLPMGDYYRYLDSAYYAITFSAPHYYSKTIDSVRIERGQMKKLDVALVPDYTAISNVEKESFKMFPNPANRMIHIQSQEAIAEISIYSVQGMQLEYVKVNSLVNIDFDVSYLSTGVYLIQLLDIYGNSSTQKILIQ